MPPSGKFIDVDGNRIHYVEAGEGRPILFIHGLGAQFHQFRHPLFEAGREFRLVALDRPGSGYSVRARGAGAGISEQARLIVSLHGEARDRKAAGGRAFARRHRRAGDRHRASRQGLRPGAAVALTRYSDKVAPAFAPLDIAAPWRRWLIAQTFAIPTALKTARRP